MLSADDTAIYAAYQAGDLDFIDTVPTDQIASLNGIDPEFYVVDNLGTYYVSFNVKSPLFDGKTVEQANAMRRAFAMLVDRQYIIDTVAQTGQLPEVHKHLADGAYGSAADEGAQHVSCGFGLRGVPPANFGILFVCKFTHNITGYSFCMYMLHYARGAESAHRAVQGNFWA